MNVFFSYLLLGLSLAAPIGPVNAAQLDRGIKNGFLHAWMVGIGAVLADGIYMMVVYFGVVQLIDTPLIKTFLWLFGCFVLMYTGIESLSGASDLHSNQKRHQEPVRKSFLAGFFMSISNPLTILFWLGIYGSVLAETVSSSGQSELFLYSAAIFSGLLLWDVTMAGISTTVRNYSTTRALSFISMVSSLSLIGFGIYFGYQAIQLLLHF